MRLTVWFGFIAIAAATAPLHAQSPDSSLSPDDSLRIYAVNVIHDRPFEEPFIGYAIYLGQGAVITAAHVLGRWPSFISNPRVLIAGQELRGGPAFLDRMAAWLRWILGSVTPPISPRLPA